VVKRAVREDTPNPDFALKAYIKTLFDEEMKTRRFRPPLPKRAASIPERAKQVGLGESTLEGEARCHQGALSHLGDGRSFRSLAGDPRAHQA
jgi:hypothetical protein